jgi:hypothetical protein
LETYYLDTARFDLRKARLGRDGYLTEAGKPRMAAR